MTADVKAQIVRLELAARAAGYDARYGLIMGFAGTHLPRSDADLLCRNNDLYWNPDEDDSDAFRLAIRLNLWPVRKDYNQGSVISVQQGSAEWDVLAEVEIGQDIVRSTRHAIVDAAIEKFRRSGETVEKLRRFSET